MPEAVVGLVEGEAEDLQAHAVTFAHGVGVDRLEPSTETRPGRRPTFLGLHRLVRQPADGRAVPLGKREVGKLPHAPGVVVGEELAGLGRRIDRDGLGGRDRGGHGGGRRPPRQEHRRPEHRHPQQQTHPAAAGGHAPVHDGLVHAGTVLRPGPARAGPRRPGRDHQSSSSSCPPKADTTSACTVAGAGSSWLYSMV